jgi:hypothetical protein
MTLSEFVIITNKPEYSVRRPAIICKDGTRISVQGSEMHHCKPQAFTDAYTTMEVLRESDILFDFNEDAYENLGYEASVESIEAKINYCGGIDIEATFDEINNPI